MKKVIRIDEQGLFLEDVILQDHELIPTNCIETDCQGGLYLPKWNGTEWVEGGVMPEPQPHQPTESETIMLAIAELDLQREADKLETQLAIAELAEAMLGGGV
jgi:hypothetical protein